MVTLLPFTERHFFFDTDKVYIYIFSIIAFFILTIACCNFINLATARSSARMKEIGLRKTAGANRGKLIVQFMSESVVQSFISAIFSFIIAIVFLPVLDNLTGKELMFNLPIVIALLAGLAFFVGMAGGIYPALILSAFRPALALKGHLTSQRNGVNSRRLLVIIQYSLSTALILGTKERYLKIRKVLF